MLYLVCAIGVLSRTYFELKLAWKHSRVAPHEGILCAQASVTSTMFRKSIVLLVAAAASASATVLSSDARQFGSVAFAAPALRAWTVAKTRSTFATAPVLPEGVAARIPVASDVSMMAGRRNLKKEKRARNEFYARQFRKAARPRFARGPSASDRAAKEEDDGKWLEQIYGQHSIYRRDTGAGPQAVATKPEAVSEPETLAKTTPAQSDKGESAGARELSIAA